MMKSDPKPNQNPKITQKGSFKSRLCEQLSKRNRINKVVVTKSIFAKKVIKEKMHILSYTANTRAQLKETFEVKISRKF